MKIITDCLICKNDFMYDPNHDFYLKVDLNNIGELYEKYPVKDDVWNSRRWNEGKTDFIDLSGEVAICQDCHKKRSESEDVNVDGHIICSKKGCANDSNESTKYCNRHYEEVYGK